MATKPPLGVATKKQWMEFRLSDLYGAIQRYISAGLETELLCQEWIKEAEDLEIQLELMEASK